MAEKTYRVVGPATVAGRAPGTKFKASQYTELNLAALVQGGLLEDVTKQWPRKCPACQKKGTAADKKRTYASLLDLREHYGRKHKALAAPAEEE